METSYLLAWSVPDHVSVPVEQFRLDLFRKTGCISLRALETIIPIGYIPEAMHKDDLPHDIPRPERTTWDSIEIKDGALFITSEKPVTLSDTHLGFSVTGAFPIPAVPGIFLGCSDICTCLEESKEILKFSEVSFTPSHIVQLQLQYNVLETWWEDFSFTVTKLKSLR